MNRSDGSTADYYVLPEGATQLQDLISHRNMNAQIGEIIRACYRYGMASHSDMLRDAKKIRFYAQAEVERLEKLEAASEQCGQVEDFRDSLWVRAPDWANWAAYGISGNWEFYEDKPVQRCTYWHHSSRGVRSGEKAVQGDWKLSLHARPSK